MSADGCGIRIDCKPKKFEEAAKTSGQEEPCAVPEEETRDMNEEKTKDARAQKPISPLYSRICTVCGKEFKAKSGAAKSCPECRASGRKKGDKEVKELAAELFDAE